MLFDLIKIETKLRPNFHFNMLTQDDLIKIETLVLTFIKSSCLRKMI